MMTYKWWPWLVRMRSWICSWAVLLLVLSSSASDGRRDDLIVSTEKGRVRGVRFNMPHLDSSVYAFLGIPFAKPPTGHLRYRHPQPIDPWKGIYNATKLPNSCYQARDDFFKEFKGSQMWNPNTKVSEDCLYLNVWVPKTQPRLRRASVLVWIYGGGFYSGTTTLNLYDGKVLAATQNVIVVSIGYRVGALGFLSLGHSSAPGNAGMFDQLMGLEWVQQNIRHFGGDPENVTLVGESAGSVSVSLHLLSPLSRNKFSRAIMQSGTANMPWATYSMDEGKRRSLEFANSYMHCPDTDDMQAIASCLRELEPQKIVEKQWVSRGILQFPFLPVIDGAFLVESPLMSLKRQAFKKCPILLGSNLNEATFFLMYDLDEYLKLHTASMTRAQFDTSMASLFYHYPQYPIVMNSFGLEAVKFQYTNWLDRDDQLANILALDNAVGDAHFTCNVNEFAHTYARAGENVFSYYFTQRYTSNPWPAWMGVLHGDEIIYTFGEPLRPGLNFTEEEKQFSLKMMTYWTNFAMTGDPNRTPGHRSLSEWPSHTPKGKEYLELNFKILHNAVKSDAVGRGPRVKECAFWKEYLPQLVAATGKSPSTVRKNSHLPSVYIQPNVTCAMRSASSSSRTSGFYPTGIIMLIVTSLVFI